MNMNRLWRMYMNMNRLWLTDEHEHTHRYLRNNYVVLLQCAGVDLTRFIHRGDKGGVKHEPPQYRQKLCSAKLLHWFRRMHLSYRSLFTSNNNNSRDSVSEYYTSSRSYLHKNLLYLQLLKHPLITAQITVLFNSSSTDTI